ncbi:MAG TPA: CPBP family intramembrane glutamic endopeptidase [Myxococcota bacterium]|nr:CPBP family intramembrane glutamic endopeptidase [Myxococcota bacterium]
MPEPPARTPSSLAAAYLLPYLLYVAPGAVFDVRAHALLVYGARLVAVGAALAWFRADYRPLRGPRSPLASVAVGAVAGLAGTALWLALRAPFPAHDATPWSDTAWLARALGSALLPPIVEELLFRGYALRVILLLERARRAGTPARLGDALDRSSLADVAPGAWSAFAVAGSSALFAAGHWPAEWPAAFAYGGLMCALWIARGDLLSCISAHAVTNAAPALLVRAGGERGIW